MRQACAAPQLKGVEKRWCIACETAAHSRTPQFGFLVSPGKEPWEKPGDALSGSTEGKDTHWWVQHGNAGQLRGQLASGAGRALFMPLTHSGHIVESRRRQGVTACLSSLQWGKGICFQGIEQHWQFLLSDSVRGTPPCSPIIPLESASKNTAELWFIRHCWLYSWHGQDHHPPCTEQKTLILVPPF